MVDRTVQEYPPQSAHLAGHVGRAMAGPHCMRTPRADIVNARREQIVEAAVAVIAEQGLHNLSLSEIETRAGMSRGQLTYYFGTKEAILLAVFDHLLELLCKRAGATHDPPC